MKTVVSVVLALLALASEGCRAAAVPPSATAPASASTTHPSAGAEAASTATAQSTAPPAPTAAPAAVASTTVTASPAATSQAFVLKRIDTRSNVTMRFVLSVPTAARATLIMFSGSGGNNMFSVVGDTVRLGGNFLVRTSPRFVQQQLAVAVVDVPSDAAAGMTAAFRTSPAHAEDIARLIDALAAQGLSSFYLVGTSNGTISAAYLGSTLHDSRIKGVVLTSTVNITPQFSAMALDSIRVPVLVVHHRDDACVASPFAGDAALMRRMTGSPHVDFVEVRGGSPQQSDPCEPQSPHGYFGVEAPVVQAIADWITGKPVPALIGQ